MFSQTDTDEDNIYLDCLTSNIDSGPNIKSQFLTFSEMRDVPILQNCSEYNLAIVRFQLSTSNLPIMIFPVQVGQSDINKGTYSITLKYGLFEVQTFVEFITPNIGENVQPPLLKQDFSNSYYEIYSYQYFINLLNTAFQTCYTALNVAAGRLPSAYPPYLSYDVDLGKATLNAETGYNSDSSQSISIFFNTGLFSLFSSFDALYYGTSNVTNGKNYKFNVIVSPNNTNILTFGNAFIPGSTVINYIQCYQEYPSLAESSQAISSIVFTSNLIPIQGSLQSKPILFNALGNVLQQTQNNTAINMITDITVDSPIFSAYKPSLIYIPQIYRLVPLQGNAVLRSYDISVFYKDRYGNIKPFNLAPSGSSSIKILFQKKK